MKRRLMTVLWSIAIASGWAWTGVLASAEEWTAPPETKSLENPFTVTGEASESAKTLFTQQCSTCHGTSGKGDGPAGQYLGKPLPDFTSAVFQAQTTGEIFWKVTNGKAPMPTFADILSDEQRWLVVEYIRTFSDGEHTGGSK